jgi:membrane protein
MRLTFRSPKVTQVVDAVKRMFGHLERVRTFGLAAEMAFWVFLSLIPLAAVAGLVAAKVATENANAAGPFLMAMPPATRQFVQGELGNVAAWNGGSVALPAIVMFVWLASSGIHSIFDALEIQTQSSRPWWKKRLLALAACVALSVGIASVTLLMTGLGWIEQLLHHALPVAGSTETSLLGKLVRFVVGAGVALGLEVGLFWFGVPPIARNRLPVLPGALLATVLQGALGYGYSFYIGKAGDGGAYQGALAAIGVTLTALYLLSCAILLGAELNRFLGARKGVCVATPLARHPESRLHHEPPSPDAERRARHAHPAR